MFTYWVVSLVLALWLVLQLALWLVLQLVLQLVLWLVLAELERKYFMY